MSALLAYLKKCGVPQKTYFTDFAPRFDLLTGEKIPYKSPPDRYLKIDFAHKNNLKKFLKEKPEDGKKWAIEWLKNRKEDKGLIYAPTQVELRSLMCPTTLYYDSVGGYSAICQSLGYKTRFDGVLSSASKIECQIIVDTREQTPLSLDAKTIVEKLNCGDYGLPTDHDNGIYIERKSLGDLIGTLTSGKAGGDHNNLARFTRELERAAEIGGYLIMLVECNINDAMGFNHLPKDKCPPFVRYCKVSPDHIFKNLRDLLVKFPLNFQTLFVNNRTEAAKAVVRLLSSGESVKSVDLQAAYEKKILKFDE